MLTDGKKAVIAMLGGIGVYYCEWLELIIPGFCNQSLGFALTRMYVVPLLLAGVIGYFGYRKPLLNWFLFMVPSWVLRDLQILIMGGNLMPPVIAIDSLHLIFTGLIAGGVARYRNPVKSKTRVMI